MEAMRSQATSKSMRERTFSVSTICISSMLRSDVSTLTVAVWSGFKARNSWAAGSAAIPTVAPWYSDVILSTISPP
ncbi:MAG: hypothetical protein ACRDWH_11190 [Acidimicrobiia bacterium]